MTTTIATRGQAAPPLVRRLLDPAMREQIRLALPRHCPPDRYCRMLLTALRETPKLLDCDELSVIGGMFTLAQLGLEPGGPLGHAWLIPFRQQGKLRAQLIIGYKGFVTLAGRAGITLMAEAVYEGDQFEFELGTTPRIIHRPTEDIERRGEIRYGYAVATYADGRKNFKVVTRADIAESMRASHRSGEADSPWQQHRASMVRKTAILRLRPFLDLSAEIIAGAGAAFAQASVLAAQAADDAPQEFALPAPLQQIDAAQASALEARAKERGVKLPEILGAFGYERADEIQVGVYQSILAEIG